MLRLGRCESTPPDPPKGRRTTLFKRGLRGVGFGQTAVRENTPQSIDKYSKMRHELLRHLKSTPRPAQDTRTKRWAAFPERGLRAATGFSMYDH